jgi:acetyl esterase/lipase
MPSLQARLIEWLLPLSGFRRLLASEEAFRRGLPRITRRGPALPSRRMRRLLDISEREAHGSRVFTIAPRQAAAGGRHILFLHGGGYFCDITAAHWSIVARLIRRTGATVTVPLYPLAPQHTVTDVLALLLPLCRALTAEVGAGSLTLMGDSSGAGISLALAQLLRDHGGPLPANLVLLSPWLDATLSDPSQPKLAETDRLLAIPGAREAGAMYAGDLDPRSSFPKFESYQAALSSLWVQV